MVFRRRTGTSGFEAVEIRSGLKQVNSDQDRDAKGRFSPGRSGNPSGRPPGIADKRVSTNRALLEPLLPEAVDKLRQAVSAGEKWAVEMIVAYCLPKPKPVDTDELAQIEARLEQLEINAGALQ